MVYFTNRSHVGPTFEAVHFSTKAVYEMTEQPTLLSLKEFYSRLDGSRYVWEDVKPLVRSNFHPDFKCILDDKEIGYHDFIALLAKFTQNGCIAHLEHAREEHDGSVSVIVNNVLPKEDGDVTLQRLFYEDEMIIRCEPVGTHKAKFRALLDRVLALPEEDREIQSLKEFISNFDGTHDAWENIQPILSSVFHSDFKLVLDTKELNFSGIVKFSHKATQMGCIRKLEHAYKNCDGSVSLILNDHLPDKDGIITEQTMHFRKGMVIKCEAAPADKMKYSAFVHDVLALSQKGKKGPNSHVYDDLITEKLTDFISTLDGSPDAWSRAKPLLEDLYHCDTIFVTEKGEKSREWFKCFVKTFTNNQNIASIESVQRTGMELRVCTSFVVMGKAIGSVEQRAVMNKAGKIVFWEAVPVAMRPFSTRCLIMCFFSDKGGSVIFYRHNSLIWRYFQHTPADHFQHY